MSALEQALVRIAAFLEAESIPYMVFGGLAVLHWGEPRLTRDVDVKLLLEDRPLAGLVARLVREFPSRTPDSRVREVTTGLERPDRLAAFEALLVRAGLSPLADG